MPWRKAASAEEPYTMRLPFVLSRRRKHQSPTAKIKKAVSVLELMVVVVVVVKVRVGK